MAETLLCKICGIRRPKRNCPAVSGDICSICCGTEREVSLSCPLECSYLKEAHRREKPIDATQVNSAYPEVSVSEEQVRQNEELLLFCVYALQQAALRTPGAVDSDLMIALEALIRTRRSLDSGLIYQSRPDNSIAAQIQKTVDESLDDYEREREQREALSPLKNSELLALLVFLHRAGSVNQNGRPRGRSFIDLLHQMTPDSLSTPETASGIII